MSSKEITLLIFSIITVIPIIMLIKNYYTTDDSDIEVKWYVWLIIVILFCWVMFGKNAPLGDKNIIEYPKSKVYISDNKIYVETERDSIINSLIYDKNEHLDTITYITIYGYYPENIYGNIRKDFIKYYYILNNNKIYSNEK